MVQSLEYCDVFVFRSKRMDKARGSCGAGEPIGRQVYPVNIQICSLAM